ncbi:MAG: EAL domain-containing protein, partial [Geminicoccaceae bacterium]|nr:EAL domain-containing protein [Geminicoccaceae bacterium]
MTSLPGLRSLLALLVLLAVALVGGLHFTSSIWRLEENLPVEALHDATDLDLLSRDIWRFRLAAERIAAAPTADHRLIELALSRNALISSIGHLYQHLELSTAQRTSVDRLISNALGAAEGVLRRDPPVRDPDLERLRLHARALADFIPRLSASKHQRSLNTLIDQQRDLQDLKVSVTLLWALGFVAAIGCGLFALRQRRAEQAAGWARQQLRNAIESIGEGFALFDADDRLVMHNRRYVDLYPSLAPGVLSGTSFAHIAARFLNDASSREDRARRAAWNAMRLAWRTEHVGEAGVFQTPEGRWLRLTDSRTADGGTVSVQSDVTEAKRREEALRASETRFRSLSESSPIGIFQVDASNRAVYANPALCRMFGVQSFEQIEGEYYLTRFAPEYHDLVRYHRAQRELGITSSFEADLIAEDGRRVHVLVTGTPLLDASGVLSGVLVTMLDITARKAAEARVRHLAEHDVLCGLPNRALFSTRVQEAIVDRRAAGPHFAVLAIDIDHFKEVNDSLGHAAGDALLCQVAKRLQAAVRGSDMVARLSGDEFAVLLRDIRDQEDAQAIAWNVVARLREPFLIDGQVIQSSASVGLALFPDDGTTTEELLRHGDLALYESKTVGRNACTRFRSAMSERMAQRKQLERRLWHALDSDALTVLYQPQVDLKSGQVVGAEALVRWTDPELGSISPGDFIPVAEASGLIVPLGEWVLKTACMQAAAWAAEGLAAQMSVNLSSVQVKRADLGTRVMEILAEAGLGPARLELEITEGVLLEDTERVRRSLQELRHAGIGLALDDFGTGYSSLGYLKRFPADRIKIDRSFVADLGRSAQDDALVKAVIALGHSLGMRVIAEGVEQPAQIEFLRAYDCDQVQGFHIGRPMP